MDRGNIQGAILAGRPDRCWRAPARLGVYVNAIGGTVPVGVAVALGYFGGIVFLRGEEVAPQRVRELEIGSECAWLANDGRTARDDIPGKTIPQSACRPCLGGGPGGLAVTL
jgi:hypothetical protein